MATLNAIARPYAQAAYAFALSKQDLGAWSQFLETASEVIQRPELSRILSNSLVLPQQWFSLLAEILSPNLDENKKNFLHLLTENQRLPALPEIAQLFKDYEAQNKQVTEIHVTTAVLLSAIQKQQLTDKLTRSFNSQVNLRCEIDEHILGGAIVRAGDKVIDGSIRGQLKRLLEFAIR